MYEQLKQILIDEMSIDENDITPDANFMSDLGFNSLELADLVLTCEDHFQIEFDESVLPTLLTVGDVVNYLEENA